MGEAVSLGGAGDCLRTLARMRVGWDGQGRYHCAGLALGGPAGGKYGHG